MPRRLAPIVVCALLAAACGSDGSTTADGPAAESANTTSTSAAPSTTIASPSTTSTTVTSPTTTVAPAGCLRVTDFDDTSWVIVNDGVMGGRSSATGTVSETGLTWTGTIVTAGGGFSSIRGPVDGLLADATSLTMRIRTDGRSYELLADDTLTDRGRVTHYAPIEAVGGEWEEVSVPLTDMEARIFGNPATADPFVPELASQIGVILADGVDGDFSFEIDWIDACE